MRSRSRILLGLIPCLAGIAVELSTSEAKAMFEIGVDPQLALLGSYGLGFGGGIGGRLGWRFGAGPRRGYRGPFLTVEGGGEYISFGQVEFNAPTITNENLYAGIRAGFSSRFVEPQVYGHLGVGWVNEIIPNYCGNATGFCSTPFGFANINPRLMYTATALSLEGGGALNFKLVRHFRLGLHIGPEVTFATPVSLSYLKLGAQAEGLF
jgi:hypothetical protein